MPAVFTRTGYELPNFAARSRRQAFSIGAAPRLDGALCRSWTAPALRRSAFALAHATPRAPMPFRKIVADNFFPVIGVRAMVNSRVFGGVSPGRSSRPRRRKNWRKRDSGSTDRQPLDFPRNGQGKSLEILGKVWKSLEFPWNFLGKIWKSWKKLGATAIGYSTPNGPASAGARGPRGEAEENRFASR